MRVCFLCMFVNCCIRNLYVLSGFLINSPSLSLSLFFHLLSIRGIDLKSRGIWKTFEPYDSNLLAYEMYPKESVFADADWIIGNHSDGKLIMFYRA